MARSAEAPSHWEMHDTEAHVRSIILDRSPDVVCFQELPGLIPFVETHSPVGSNPKTHSGNLATLVGNHLMEPAPRWHTVGNFAVCVTVGGMTIANVHLASGPAAASERLDQLELIAASAPETPLIVVGDTNTRVSEEPDISALGFSNSRPPLRTWDSTLNRFNNDRHEFSAYFSRWFPGEGLETFDPWVDTKPVTTQFDQQFFVSDHYAIGATVRRRPVGQ